MSTEARIGRFELRRRIGRGGAGDVHLVYDPENALEVALKVIHAGISDPEMLEAEKRGAEIQQRLSLEVPQIARVYETGQIGEQFFIVMEYVRGIDLSELLRAQPLPEPRAVSFAVQLCSILEACGRVSRPDGQRDRFIHGDIKPQNIRVEEGDRLRLLDFGVAKSVSLTRQYTGNVFGSLPYLSPERLTDTRVSIQSDLWSVGVVLYEMITGQLPYPTDSDEVLRAHILRGGFPQPPHPRLRAPLQAILSRCLEADPTLRYPEAAELRAALEALDELDEPVAASGSETTRTRLETLPWAVHGAPTKRGKPRFRERFSRDARAELEQFQDRLRRMHDSIPSRAQRFRKVVEDLERDLGKTASGWRIGRDSLDLLRDRVIQLDDVAAPLTALIREAEQIDKQAGRLEAGIQALSDPQTRSFLQGLSRGWRSDLQKTGADIYRRPDLRAEQEQVRTIRDDVQLYDQVLGRLDEAERILAILGATGQTAPLSAGLLTLHEQLRQQGPSDAWMQGIQALVQPLREPAKQAKDPKQELRRLFRSIEELRGWAEAVGDLKTEAEGLERRHRALGPTARMNDVEALDHDCAELLGRLTRRAQELRDGKLAELEERVALLASVCDTQNELEERLRGLRRKRLDVPQSLSEWMSQFEQVCDQFRTAVQNQESGLRQGLAEAVGRLREKLEALHGQPLSSAAQQEVLALGDDIRELERTTGAGEILRGLSRCGELASRIEQLRQRIMDDLQELFRQQQTLKEVNEDLQAQARQAGIEIPDLSQRIDELDEGAKEPSLERARQLADSLSADLDRSVRHFEEQCRKVLGEQVAEIGTVAAALQRIGSPWPAASLPVLASGAQPREAAQAVMAGLELARAAREAAYQVFRAQEERLQEARSILRLDHREELGEDEKKAAERYLAEIEEDLANAETNRIGRLERRALLIDDCGPLLSRLHQDERTARELLALLRERLQRQTNQDLRRFCPREIADRVADLVYGIPERPRQWQTVKTQLAEAERLLALVEIQTARLAAAELSQAVGELRAASGERTEIDPLLAELSRYQESLPPWSLRQRILAARERQRQAHGGRA
jgi:serine/threonine protein kinase